LIADGDVLDLELQRHIENHDIIDFSADAAALLAEARSRITVGAGASLISSGNIVLHASAESSAVFTTNGTQLGITYASSSPTAEVIVENGALIQAGQDVAILAFAKNTLAVNTIVREEGTTANVSISYANAESVSHATVEAGATITAQNATVRAEMKIPS